MIGDLRCRLRSRGHPALSPSCPRRSPFPIAFLGRSLIRGIPINPPLATFLSRHDHPFLPSILITTSSTSEPVGSYPGSVGPTIDRPSDLGRSLSMVFLTAGVHTICAKLSSPFLPSSYSTSPICSNSTPMPASRLGIFDPGDCRQGGEFAQMSALVHLIYSYSVKPPHTVLTFETGCLQLQVCCQPCQRQPKRSASRYVRRQGRRQCLMTRAAPGW